MNSKKFLVFFLIAVLFVPGCARGPRRAPTVFYEQAPAGAQGIWHTVARGQTLYRISKLYGVDVAELMRANNIGHPGGLEVGQRLFIPRTYGAPSAAQPVSAAGIEDARRIVGSRYFASNWRTITVHHSATHQGGAGLFDRDHRRRKMGGLFYHFVIGNGTATPDGLIEVGWRWKKQVPANRPNDIQICLVGNFDEQLPSDAQFESLVNLIRVLREEYNIPVSSIRQHRDIPGKHTDCPGTKFPFSRLISELSRYGG